MDCLDRTNVVQSALAKHVLNRILRQTDVLGYKESIDDHPHFLHIFRNVWADNADTVSRAYSGTGALKTDYTRSGIRTKEGALQDGINSAVRYIKNNFLDGPRQDAYDLVTGTWVPRKDGNVLFADNRPLLTRLMPLILLISVFVLIFGWAIAKPIYQYLYPTQTFVFFWFSAAVLSIVYIFAHGIDYVAWPRLIPLDDAINYQVKKKIKSHFVDSEKLKQQSVTEIEMGTRDKQRVD